MDFGEVLSKAWNIVWKHKILWIFGIFAGCARGGGGGGSGWSSGSGWQEQGQPFRPNTALEIQRFFLTLGDWISSHLWEVVLFILVGLILIALVVFLGTIGRIGLIRGTNKADGGVERLAFGELFRESLPFFWRVFGLSFLVGLAFAVILIPPVVFGVITAGIGLACFLPLICLLIPAAWVVNLVIHQADAAMVIDNLGIVDGVRRGWNVVIKNLGTVFIIWLITAFIGFVVAIVIALPVLVIVIPAVIAYAAASQQLPTAVFIVAGACLVVYIPILIVANGILTAYLESVWALTYLRLTQRMQDRGTPAALPANA